MLVLLTIKLSFTENQKDKLHIVIILLIIKGLASEFDATNEVYFFILSALKLGNIAFTISPPVISLLLNNHLSKSVFFWKKKKSGLCIQLEGFNENLMQF